MLTGGEKVKARHMRQDLFEFTPQLKLLITGNHKPSLRSADEATRRRFNLIPFTVTIPKSERDPALPEMLKTEWGGILRWAIAGCLEWQRIGLQAPAVVREATEAYMDAEDALGAWIDERCHKDPQATETLAALYADWRSWAEKSGEYVGTNRALGQKLVDREYAQHKTERGQTHIGLKLRYGMQAAAEAAAANAAAASAAAAGATAPPPSPGAATGLPPFPQRHVH
jgi:putative DNA primase/helicase